MDGYLDLGEKSVVFFSAWRFGVVERKKTFSWGVCGWRGRSTALEFSKAEKRVLLRIFFCVQVLAGRLAEADATRASNSRGNQTRYSRQLEKPAGKTSSALPKRRGKRRFLCLINHCFASICRHSAVPITTNILDISI